LAAPTHWYYGGTSQIRADYGSSGITDYTKPKMNLPVSILNKSNVNGGGRGSFDTKRGTSIIGDVINHGKRKYWDPKLSIHYHATLEAGENTLEAQLVRVLMKSIIDTGGRLDPDHFRNAYIKFMTTPGSHNDVYASTCHRMFFANLVLRKLPSKDCPDNDQHNVDTIDGLVLPTIAALAVGAREGVDQDVLRKEAREASVRTISVTRRSSVLESAGTVWSDVVLDSLHEQGDLSSSVMKAAKALGMRMPRFDGPDEMRYVH